MKRRVFGLLALSFLVLNILALVRPFAAIGEGNLSVVAEGAQLKELKSGFIFAEGPAVDAAGNVYFSDIQAEKIYKWSWKDDVIALHRENSGRSNGLMFNREGHLIVCEMGNLRVTSDDLKGEITVLADQFEGKPLHSPNDLWIDPRGGIYFSDWMSGGGRNQRRDQTRRDRRERDRNKEFPTPERDSPAGGLQVYYILPDSKKIIRVTSDLVKPNGLIGSSDGRQLFIADAGDRKTWLYSISPDGTLADKTLFCEQGSDGMTRDEQGNIYLTSRESIVVYNRGGRKIGEIVIPGGATNMTFAGKEGKTLFITSRPTVYLLEMAVRGDMQ